MSEHTGDTSSRVLGYAVPILGIALLLLALPFYLASGLMAPLWAIILLLLVWAALFALACGWFRRHPYRVLVLPFLAVGVWFGAMSAGEKLLGWTA